MSKPEPRISDLKARLNSLIDSSALVRVGAPGERQRQRDWGMAMLVLSVFVLVAGVNLPSGDAAGRSIFVFGAILYALVGAWSFDRGNRRD